MVWVGNSWDASTGELNRWLNIARELEFARPWLVHRANGEMFLACRRLSTAEWTDAGRLNGICIWIQNWKDGITKSFGWSSTPAVKSWLALLLRKLSCCSNVVLSNWAKLCERKLYPSRRFQPVLAAFTHLVVVDDNDIPGIKGQSESIEGEINLQVKVKIHLSLLHKHTCQQDQIAIWTAVRERQTTITRLVDMRQDNKRSIKIEKM